ncbi:biopolymer transporter ExbB [Phaeobacter gallaeciensis]|uniref:Biopolymer transporter ExbB n=2 Tax=Roseobacteraceae TaxID=2854170 RepID=A0A366X3F0_9RHOB|nr:MULTISPECIES: biopolymer transporter ExbB [Roseobacteraceae]MBT3139640.1 biopolymer transporter ExbB [Falsiruegeria litorea]MBT8169942.1 biopolymer transporter ExbB [Falsiruegeria litorea]RBW58509.1 biopolymer transporter ExbB [Phaeobacter gallaeciensis]
MAQQDSEVRPQFSQPIRQITMMLMVIALSGFGIFVALPRVLPVFQANPYLNGFILLVFVIGVFACFWQVIQLIGSVRWIEEFASGNEREGITPPQLLTPLASLLRSRAARMHISSTSTRSILDSVAERIEEEREITRYITNVLIYLGLLGTFFGLATTIPAVVDTIRSLAPQEGEEGLAVFGRLMTGLEAQLGGMGVAFGSSLLGLAGSLIVGLLELFAGHGQNRFYRELEEWLSTITRLGFASGEDSSGSDNAMLTHVMDRMGEQMESLQGMFAASSEENTAVNAKLSQLVESISDMNHRAAESQDTAIALDRVAAVQETLVDVIRAQGENEGIDAESRMRLRSIDVQMLRILEEMSAGRQETMVELRKDIDLLANALSQPRGQTRVRGTDGE